MTHAVSFQQVSAPVHGDDQGGPWSFAVASGSVVGIEADPSVADAIVGLCVGSLAPTRGTVEVLGERPHTLPRARRQALLRRMGVAFQREGLVSNISLEENLVIPLLFASGIPRAEARGLAREAMAELGLTAHAGRRPAELTREARIVGAVARAALRRPELLILEYLTANLPDRLAERALRWCRDRSGTIVVIVPGRSAALEGLVDPWIPRLQDPVQEDPDA